ncbi:hypothetical protein BCV70DRAFT_199286 [Testicularia cyperi]|uniref:Uncharacterized protein n=1 Tax=Testicularia cyperi TaxID=1882483 RepID=A0A317XU73_9BASI|nr:hypothetical protein BCV70DRAFT_199286 [Testicularia cyperi]
MSGLGIFRVTAAAAGAQMRLARGPTLAVARQSSPLAGSIPLRGFASSSSSRSALTDPSSSSASAAYEAPSALSAPASESGADSASTAAEVVAANGGFELLQPWVPTIHNLADTLHFSGPHAHALSIFAVAFAVRTVVTLPVTLWQRSKTRKLSEKVLPEWKILKEQIPQTVRARCRRSGKSYEEFEVEVRKELKEQLAQLLRKHKASPLPALFGPATVSIPVFLLMTALLRQSALDPSTPFASEVLPWWEPSPELAAQFKASTAILADRGFDDAMIDKLKGTMGGPTLVDRDSTMYGPVAFGMLTLANTELNSWSRRSLAKISAAAEADAAPAATRTNRPDAAAKAADKLLEQPEEEPRRSRIITNALRVLAIAFIPIASQAPGVLVVYWLSSGVYTLLQNSVLTILDRRRELRKTQSSLTAQGRVSP